MHPEAKVRGPESPRRDLLAMLPAKLVGWTAVLFLLGLVLGALAYAALSHLKIKQGVFVGCCSFAATVAAIVKWGLDTYKTWLDILEKRRDRKAENTRVYIPSTEEIQRYSKPFISTTSQILILVVCIGLFGSAYAAVARIALKHADQTITQELKQAVKVQLRRQAPRSPLTPTPEVVVPPKLPFAPSPAPPSLPSPLSTGQSPAALAALSLRNLTGIVYHDLGQPALNTLVIVRNHEGTVVGTAVSDTNGAFGLRVTPGSYEMVILSPNESGDGFESTLKQQITVADDKALHLAIDLSMKDEDAEEAAQCLGTLFVKVVDQYAQPLANAEVEVNHLKDVGCTAEENPPVESTGSVFTDNKGVFTLPWPVSTFSLSSNIPGCGETGEKPVTIIAATRNNVDLQMTAAPETGSLRILGTDSMDEGSRLALSAKEPAFHREFESHGNETVVSCIPPGLYELSDRAALRVGILVVANQETAVWAKTPKPTGTGSLRISVVDENAAPVVYAKVTDGGGTWKTDESGNLLLGELPPGELMLVVSKGGFHDSTISLEVKKDRLTEPAPIVLHFLMRKLK